MYTPFSYIYTLSGFVGGPVWPPEAWLVLGRVQLRGQG